MTSAVFLLVTLSLSAARSKRWNSCVIQVFNVERARGSVRLTTLNVAPLLSVEK